MAKKLLSEQIREARKALKYSQQHLANLTGLSINTINALENNHEKTKNPTVYVIKHLQNALNIKFDIWD